MSQRNPLFDWYEMAAIVAYYESVDAAADALDIDADVIDDALHGFEVTRADYGELESAVADLAERYTDEWEQIQAINEIFVNEIPDPSLEVIIEGITEGRGNVMDMIDAWRADDGDIWAENSHFWTWYRALSND